MVDAPASGAGARKGVEVRVSRAPSYRCEVLYSLDRYRLACMIPQSFPHGDQPCCEQLRITALSKVYKSGHDLHLLFRLPADLEAYLTAFRPIPRNKRSKSSRGAGVPDPQRLITDFATAGLVKAYALVIETRQDHGRKGSCEEVQILRSLAAHNTARAADEVWAGGTIRFSAVPAEGWRR